jgi:predicted DNA-binding protein
MAKKWVGKKKTFNLSQAEVDKLKSESEKTGRTETDILREALRQYWEKPPHLIVKY